MRPLANRPSLPFRSYTLDGNRLSNQIGMLESSDVRKPVKNNSEQRWCINRVAHNYIINIIYNYIHTLHTLHALHALHTLQYITYITLPYITLHYIALHCIAYMHTCIHASIHACMTCKYIKIHKNTYKIIQVVPGQAGGGSFKFETLIAYRAEQRLRL